MVRWAWDAPGGVGGVGRAAPEGAGAASRSGRRGEELEGDAVGIAEAEPGPVVSVLDLAVGDAQLVEAARPLLQLAAVGAAERDVVEAGAELAERLGRDRPPVLVQP